MLTTRFKMCWAILLSIPMLMIGAVDLFAHAGHDDPVTISRGSIVYLKAIIPHYLVIQEKLAAGSFDGELKKAAMEIKKVMEEAGLKEKDPSGRRMFTGVASSSDSIAGASTVEKAREGFSTLNDKLLPFFDAWPSHIKENGLILYTCKGSKKWWLQRPGVPANPYGEGAKTCGELTQKGG